MDASTVVIITIAVALAFDVINGFHDAANSIATIVSTRVLSPRLAVLWAATFNFVALWFFGEGVAKTIAGIIVIKPGDPAFVWVVMCGLLGAITWNLMTWWWGLPSSSSHALIGGVGGAGVAYAGFKILVWKKIKLVLIFIIGAPLIGLVLGSLMMLLLAWVFRRWRPQKVDQRLPHWPAVLGRGVLDRPRRQRRPEDDGHHRRGHDRGRADAPGEGLLRSRTGSSWRRTAAWRSAPRSAAGASSRPWAWA
jgi:phosphate/sulfate permease